MPAGANVIRQKRPEAKHVEWIALANRMAPEKLEGSNAFLVAK
jgi:hypothetical protein